MTRPNEITIREASTDLERQATAGIVRAIPSEHLEQSISEYTRVQGVLDRAMPDSIMRIGKKMFRKKQYWRGVRMAFNLEVVCVGEQRVEYGTDWGYTVTYRATAPNSSTADGDGACMASEKSAQQRTVHNVRSHAHTRAMNRAISNLVGFGEVSAEEAEREYDDSDDRTPAPVDSKPPVDAKPRHDPSWPADHKRFMAQIADLGHSYDTLADAVEANDKYGKRPSQMTQPERDALYDDLARAYNDASMANRVRQEEANR